MATDAWNSGMASSDHYNNIDVQTTHSSETLYKLDLMWYK